MSEGKKIWEKLLGKLGKLFDSNESKLESIYSKIKDIYNTVKEVDGDMTNLIDESEKNIINNNNAKSDEILSYLKKEVQVAESEKNKALDSIKDEKLKSDNLQSSNTKLSANIETLRVEKNTLEGQKETLAKENDSANNELRESKKQLDELSPFKDIFMSEKVMNLLETILVNPTLKEYREDKNIVDKSAQSIYNLLLQLATPQVFVKSYYEKLVDYKKKNQEQMTTQETDFYENINKFFEEEIIINPTKIKIDEDFDKSLHRGINMDSKGSIDNGIILIPSDTTNNDKIKVKMEE